MSDLVTQSNTTAPVSSQTKTTATSAPASPFIETPTQSFNQVLGQVISAVQVVPAAPNAQTTIGLLTTPTATPLSPTSAETLIQQLMQQNIANAAQVNSVLAQASTMVGYNATFSLDGIVRAGIIQSVVFNPMNNQVSFDIDNFEVPVENLMEVSPSNASHQ